MPNEMTLSRVREIEGRVRSPEVWQSLLLHKDIPSLTKALREAWEALGTIRSIVLGVEAQHPTTGRNR